jgi:hypothetical protein
MTAPGNSIVLILLLAAFLACTGYAGGRLHQWYRMGQDRDEAYRDGYDTATRSVFSLAARIISPRRADRSAIRASAAVVIPASAVVETATSPLPAVSAPPFPAAARSFLSSGDPLVDPPSAVPSTGASAGSDDASAGSDRASAGSDDASAGSDRASAGSDDASAGSDRASARQATADQPRTRSMAPSEADSDRHASEMMAGGRDVPETAADGGRYVPDAETGGGRHMVPDELVQAATYRLPPDRVARAKVPGACTPSELGADPTWWLPPVPKPRSTQ